MIKRGTLFYVLTFVIISSIFTNTHALSDEEEIKYFEELTPVSEEDFDFTAQEILNMKLKFNIMQKLSYEPWDPETDVVKGIYKIPYYDLENRICSYTIIGYIGEGEMPTLEELKEEMEEYWKDRINSLHDEDMKVNSKRDGFFENWKRLNEIKQDLFNDRFVFTHMYPYMEFDPIDTVNYGLSELYVIPPIREELNVIYPGSKVEFSCIRWVGNEPYFEFEVDGEMKYPELDKKLHIEKVYDLEDLLTDEEFPEIFTFEEHRLEIYRKKWDMFINRDYEAIEEYRQMILDTIENKHGILGIEDYVPDFEDRYDDGCTLSSAASVFAYAVYLNIYTFNFEDYSNDPEFYYIDEYEEKTWDTWKEGDDSEYFYPHDKYNNENTFYKYDGYGGQFEDSMKKICEDEGITYPPNGDRTNSIYEWQDTIDSFINHHNGTGYSSVHHVWSYWEDINIYDDTIWVIFDWQTKAYKFSSDLNELMTIDIGLMVGSTLCINSGD